MLKAEHINAFLESASDILFQTCGIKLTKENTYLKQGFNDNEDILICIGMTGDMESEVIFDIKKQQAMVIASKMMGGMEVKELDEMSMSAISELGNMVMGHTSIKLSQLGTNVDIKPPQILARENSQSKLKYICVPMLMDIGGVIDVNIGLPNK